MATSTTTRKTKTASVESVKPEEASIIPKEIDPSMIIPVLNGFHGRLVYESKRTGELFMWEEFGDTQEMELKELRNMKSSAKGFFVNNWVLFDEDYSWVVDYLGLKQYYKNAISIEGFDGIFEKTPAQATKIISGMSDGQKRSLMYRASQLIANGDIDSRKMIDALEKSLGVELIEK